MFLHPEMQKNGENLSTMVELEKYDVPFERK